MGMFVQVIETAFLCVFMIQLVHSTAPFVVDDDDDAQSV